MHVSSPQDRLVPPAGRPPSPCCGRPRGRRRRLAVACGFAALAAIAWAEIAADPAAEPIRPIAQDRPPLDQRKVALGERLFSEPMLSKDNTISCASCHPLTTGGMDRRVRSIGVGGAQAPVNAPTVFNAAFNFRQFWDGRADSLEDQIDGPIQSPVEMNSAWPDIVRKLRGVEGYVREFAALYRDGVQPKNVKNAIAEFERSLITPDSRFDRFLRGEETAISAREKEGYRKFKRFGCASCHQGVNVGGNMFQLMGTMAPYFKGRTVTTADLGRYNLTGREEDKHVFKVPGLRNVALTAPYLHDGSAETLEEAVRAMAIYQLGRRLAPSDEADIVAFLRTLTGEYQGRPL